MAGSPAFLNTFIIPSSSRLTISDSVSEIVFKYKQIIVDLCDPISFTTLFVGTSYS